MTKILTVKERTLIFYEPSEILPKNNDIVLICDKYNYFHVATFVEKFSKKEPVPYFILVGICCEASKMKYWAYLPSME